MRTVRVVCYVSNRMKVNLQLRNVFLFEIYTTPGSIALVCCDATESIRESNSWKLTGMKVLLTTSLHRIFRILVTSPKKHHHHHHHHHHSHQRHHLYGRSEPLLPTLRHCSCHRQQCIYKCCDRTTNVSACMNGTFLIWQDTKNIL
jgi:hypothetical protein